MNWWNFLTSLIILHREVPLLKFPISILVVIGYHGRDQFNQLFIAPICLKSAIRQCQLLVYCLLLTLALDSPRQSRNPQYFWSFLSKHLLSMLSKPEGHDRKCYYFVMICTCWFHFGPYLDIEVMNVPNRKFSTGQLFSTLAGGMKQTNLFPFQSCSAHRILQSTCKQKNVNQSCNNNIPLSKKVYNSFQSKSIPTVPYLKSSAIIGQIEKCKLHVSGWFHNALDSR